MCKPAFCKCKKKKKGRSAACPYRLISSFVFRCVNSRICFDHKSEFQDSSLLLNMHVAEQASLSPTYIEGKFCSDMVHINPYPGS